MLLGLCTIAYDHFSYCASLEKNVSNLLFFIDKERWDKTGLETFLIVKVCPRKWNIKDICNDQTGCTLDT